MERRSHSHRLVFAGFALSLAVAFGCALYIHQHFTRYSARVALHVPAQPGLAVWLNVEQNVGFEVFQGLLNSTLEFRRQGPEPRIKHLERKTGLELEVDTREMAFVSLDERRWLILLGGLFRRDRVLSGLSRWLSELNMDPRTEGDLVLAADGHAFGISSDGVLIASNTAEVARQALVARPGSEQASMLSKPGTFMNALIYPPVGSSRSTPSRGSGRLWVAVEPGNPFPVFVQHLGDDAGAAQMASAFLLDSSLLRPVEAPPGIQHFQGQLNDAQLKQGLARLGERMQAMIWHLGAN